MNDDVTIPRDTAKSVAGYLRSIAVASGGLRIGQQLLDYADLLDPPQPSLRDEVALVLGQVDIRYSLALADEVLAVVRKRTEGLTFWYFDGRSVVERNSVLSLLGGDCVCGHSSDRHDGEDGCIECRCHR